MMLVSASLLLSYNFLYLWSTEPSLAQKPDLPDRNTQIVSLYSLNYHRIIRKKRTHAPLFLKEN